MEGLEAHQSGHDYVSTPYDLSTLVLWQWVYVFCGVEFPGQGKSMIAWGESLVLGNRIYCNYTKTSAERRAISLSSLRDVRYPGNTYPSDDLPNL